jgi:ketosteroid isomerase-like protein
MTTTTNFDDFMDQRKEAALAYVRGDSDPVDRMSDGAGPATFFGPDGSIVTGGPAMRKSFKEGASHFLPDSTSELEILDCGNDGDLGFWTGIQHATIKVKGKDEPVPYELRITEVFRREHGAWKLVHRHADPLKS